MKYFWLHPYYFNLFNQWMNEWINELMNWTCEFFKPNKKSVFVKLDVAVQSAPFAPELTLITNRIAIKASW